MANLTKSEKSAIAAKIAEVLTNESAPAPEIKGQALADPKEFFCQNWDLVRKGLEVLSGFAPLPVKGMIILVISIGDGVKKVICT